MGRIDYLGKTVAALGVSVPGTPTIQRGFHYGVRLPGSGRGQGQCQGHGGCHCQDHVDDVTPFSPPRREIDLPTEPGADVLVLEPGEFDPDGEALVVIVNTGVLRSPRLLAELRRLTSVSPESPVARVFVPERARGQVHRADTLRRCVDAHGIPAEVVSYYP